MNIPNCFFFSLDFGQQSAEKKFSSFISDFQAH